MPDAPSNFPHQCATRSVPVQAAPGVVARFTVREVSLGDMIEPGFAAAFGRCAEAFVALGAFRDAHASGRGLAPFVAAMGDYAVCLRAVASSDDHRVDGRRWRFEDLPLPAMAALVAAFNELNLADEGKARALEAMVTTFSPALQRAQTAQSQAARGSSSSLGSRSTSSSAPVTDAPRSSPSRGEASPTLSPSPASETDGGAPPSCTTSAPPYGPPETTLPGSSRS